MYYSKVKLTLLNEYEESRAHKQGLFYGETRSAWVSEVPWVEVLAFVTERGVWIVEVP